MADGGAEDVSMVSMTEAAGCGSFSETMSSSSSQVGDFLMAIETSIF
jgi:hypothetical protein